MPLQNPNDLPKDVNGKLLPKKPKPHGLKDGETLVRHPLDDNREDGLIATLKNQGVDVSEIKSPHEIDAVLNPRPVDPPPVKVAKAKKAKPAKKPGKK